MALGDRLADDRRVPLRQKTTQPVAEFVQRGQTGNRAHEQPLQRLVFAEVAMPLGGLSHATVVFVEQHLDQEIRAVRSASPTAVTLKEGPQIKFLIDQTVDLARPMVGIELAVKPLPVGRFGRPGGLQKTTEERLSVVVDFSTISIRVTSCRTHGLKSIGENAKSSQPAGGHFLATHPCFLLGETSRWGGGNRRPHFWLARHPGGGRAYSRASGRNRVKNSMRGCPGSGWTKGRTTLRRA